MINRLILLLLAATFTLSEAFVSISHGTSSCALIGRHGRQTVRLYEQVANEASANSCDDTEAEIEVNLSAFSSAGINDNDLLSVLGAITSVCQEFGIPFEHDNIQSDPEPLQSNTLPGVLGRVILIHVSGLPEEFDVDDTELISQIKVYASEQIDNVLSENGEYKQPILLAFRNDKSKNSLQDVIAKEISDYGLTDGVSACKGSTKSDESTFLPSKHIRIDGAFVETIESPGSTHFDTSSVLVLDNLVPESLRKRLLNVVKGLPEDAQDVWDEAEQGPNPNRWERGGLIDIVDEGSEDENSDGTCWGLTSEAIEDICFNDHPSIAEFESILSQLFSDFTVSRLPEAVFGDCISPLTANAPTHGDSFDYHIDADPLQVPPSPWADVFGRYPNRSQSKPRFVSCLLYLNDEWKSEWGAPTRFLDPPTQEEVDIMPKPGRCVIMDQDISHTVVAPNAEAGKRPRYSLVWKLILHPKSANQNMADLSCGRSWPEPRIVGSANGQ